MSQTQRMAKLIDQLSDFDDPALSVLAVRMRYCLVDIIRETLDLRDEKISLLKLVKELVK
ncbi:MAG: hypothetical protein KAI86_10245 [Desulfobacterales bacterium]|nr:hypothetical protein [Desulfobacterales bacterium]